VAFAPRSYEVEANWKLLVDGTFEAYHFRVAHRKTIAHMFAGNVQIVDEFGLHRRLYLIKANGRALRYAVGVGREEALNFRGSAVIGNKEVWPRWTPTASMIARIPRYKAFAGGMPGGLENPLGARVLYLYRDKHDTFFRLHGTNEPESIGGAVSSGCIRLFNQDIIDLYNRVPVGTTVMVLQA
jgi:lipoprotein-anchoring transpeptidase ErfK/SrfK